MTSPARVPGTPPPELFTPDQLEAHASRIAATHTLASNPRRARALLPQLDRSSDRLDEIYMVLSASALAEQHNVGAEEWLRDNHHVVQDQVREVRQHLPRKYYLELPKLADGPFRGYPRVYLLARELIEHTAGRIDLEAIVEFAIAYQRTSPLSIGETWAVPIMVRLALVEELERLAEGVLDARQHRDKAHAWHERLSAGPLSDREVTRLIGESLRADGSVSPAFVVELLQWLRDQPVSAAATWQTLHTAHEPESSGAGRRRRTPARQEATTT